MAYYAYKQVRDLLPQHIIDKQGPDYEGDGNYDGDQWNAAADYIVELKEALAAKDAELERCKRAVEWCIQNSPHWDSAGLLWIDPAQINDYSRGEIPAEFDDIIKGQP